MSIVSKTRELIQGGTYNNRVLELNDIRENPLPSLEYNNEANKDDIEEMLVKENIKDN